MYHLVHLKSEQHAPAMISHPRKKSDKVLKISKTKVSISFRQTKENYTNLLPQMPKDIQSIFNKQYERRSDRNNNTTRRKHIPSENTS